jgi:hypothetical protein
MLKTIKYIKIIVRPISIIEGEHISGNSRTFSDEYPRELQNNIQNNKIVLDFKFF